MAQLIQYNSLLDKILIGKIIMRWVQQLQQQLENLCIIPLRYVCLQQILSITVKDS